MRSANGGLMNHLNRKEGGSTPPMRLNLNLLICKSPITYIYYGIQFTVMTYNITPFGPYTPSQYEAAYLISSDFFYYLGCADYIGMAETLVRLSQLPTIYRIFYIYYYHILEYRHP